MRSRICIDEQERMMGLKIVADERGYYWATGTIDGQRVRRALKTNVKKVAEDKRIDLEWRAAKGVSLKVEKKTFREAAEAFLASRPRQLGRVTTYYAERLVEGLGSMPVMDVTATDLGLWMRTNQARSSNGTRRRILKVALAVLRFAFEQGWRGPIAMMLPEDDEGRNRWLTEEERDRLLFYTPEIAWPIFVFMAHTGARVGEAIAVRWEDIEDGAHGRTVKLVSRKGTGVARTRRVPLNAMAMSALKEQARLSRLTGPIASRKGRLFRNTRGDGWGSERMLENHLAAARKLAGIEDFRLHDFRHTFASLLVQKGVALQTLAELLGHASLAMVLRYAHLGPTSGRAAVDLLE
jgi:integrase